MQGPPHLLPSLLCWLLDKWVSSQISIYPSKLLIVPLVWTVPEEPPHILLRASNTCTHLYPNPSLNRNLTYTWQWASWQQIFCPLLTCWQVASRSIFFFLTSCETREDIHYHTCVLDTLQICQDDRVLYLFTATPASKHSNRTENTGAHSRTRSWCCHVAGHSRDVLEMN